MLRRLLTSLLLVVAACSARDIEEQGQGRRHLAAQWCEDWCTFWLDCEPALAEWPVDECRASCEGDEAWDWTDHCGDLKWAERECRADASCEELRNDPEIPGGDDPCKEFVDALVIEQCTYDRPHGG